MGQDLVRRLRHGPREIGLGLIDLGMQPARQGRDPRDTRAPSGSSPTSRRSPSGCASVAIYQTNSPEECHYVLEHSESRAVFVEDADQLAQDPRGRGHASRTSSTSSIFEPEASTSTRRDLARRPARHAAARATSRSSSSASHAVTGDDAVPVHLHVGHDRPAQGLHDDRTATTATVTSMTTARDVVMPGESVYLFLPLAHSFAQLVAFTAIEVGATIAFWQKDPQKIIADLLEVKPTYFPSVPRIFEKIYTLANANAEDPASAREGGRGRPEGARAQGARRRGAGRAAGGTSTRPRRSCSSTSATCSAATSASA